MTESDPSVNVLGGPLAPCSTRPLTGFFRDGHCNTCADDRGSHTVCAVMTEEFLAFSKYLGNDLSTPRPEFRFPGLKPGDSWCLCAARFLQAHHEGFAPESDWTRPTCARPRSCRLTCCDATRPTDPCPAPWRDGCDRPSDPR